ncbi:MAG: histidine kinase [Marmoricola sp.]
MRSTERGAAVVLESLLASARAVTGAGYAALVPLDPHAPGPGPLADGKRPDRVLSRPVRVGGREVAVLELGVAVRPGRVRGEVPEEVPGEVIEGLAALAGLVLDHTRAQQRSEERLHWLEASARLTQVFAPPLTDLGAAFVETVRMARALSGAAGVALVRRKDGLVQPLAADGQRWSTIEPRLARTRWYAEDTDTAAPELLREGSGLLVVAPMLSQVKGSAALLATFTASPDPEMVGLLCAFAGQAAFAFDRAQARRADDRLRDLSERERVARDLHDEVIQRLFGVGLRVQVARADVAEPAVRATLEEVAGELDRTIVAIRSTIFTLRGAREASEEP